MKRISTLFCLAVTGLMFLLSCSSAEQKSINKMTKFVDNVEACAAEYSSDQWAVMQAQYENIRAEVNMKSVNMTPAELHAVSVQEGRFAAVVAKNYTSRMVEDADSLTDYLSGFVEGFSSDEDVRTFLESIGVDSEDLAAVKEFLDTLDVSSLVRKLAE